MHRRVMICLAVVVLLAFTVTACGSKPAEQPPAPSQPAEKPQEINVGFIYVGPVGDAGWTYAHDLGRQYLENNLPGVKTFYVESVPEGADCEREIRRLVEEHNCKVVFTTSFGFMDGTLNVAKAYPDRVFMHCSGFKTADNMGNYFGRIEQPRYLSGMVAGKMTKSNLIGYVAAFPIPEVVRGINAFTLGVRSVNPNAKVKVVWTNTWYDPAKEKDAAKGLLAVGCDVIAQHQDTPGPQQAAEEAGKYGVGYNSDMSKFAPKAFLTAPVWNWGPYYVRVVKSVMDGTWKPEAYWGPMSDGVVGLAPFGPMVPDDVKKLVEDKKQEILSGKWDVFWGPIKDQSGKVRIAEGQKMTDQEQLSIDWFVESVEGTVPK